MSTYLSLLTRIGLIAAAGALTLGAARAQAPYPSQPIRIVVPFAAAGTSDTVSRILAEPLSRTLGQAVVIDNRPGAGGNIGSEAVAKAAADGYTLLMGTVATHGINASLYKQLGFDPVKDFSPVSLVASTPSVLMVNEQVPVGNVRELIAYAKQHPLNFGSSGNGSSHHLAGELFNAMAGVSMTHVPYRGTAAAITDLMGGRIQVIFDTLPSALPHIQSGRLKAIAITSAQRYPALPDMPTIAEAALPGYEIGSWYGLLMPAGTPADVVRKVSTAIAGAVQDPDVRAKLLAQGATPIGSTPEAFGEHIRRELAKWAPIIQASGARID